MYVLSMYVRMYVRTGPPTGGATGVLCPGPHSVGGPTLLEASYCWGPIHSVTNYSPSSYIDAQYTKSRFIIKYKRDASLIYNADSRILNYHGHYVARNYNFAHNYWRLYSTVT